MTPMAGLPEDSDAARIWMRMGDRVYALLKARVANPEDRKDLLHDIYRELHAALARGAPIQNEALYVLGIARNRVAKHYRDGGRRRTVDLESVEEPVAPPLPGDTPIEPDARAALAHAFTQLDEADREVVRLTYQEGLKAPEVAARLGQRDSWVRQRLSRARKQLRTALARFAGAWA